MHSLARKNKHLRINHGYKDICMLINVQYVAKHFVKVIKKNTWPLFKSNWKMFWPLISRQTPLSECIAVGNLRTTTKFTTTMSVDLERTGTRSSVSAGKRKLKMQSFVRSTNVNKNVRLWCLFARKFFRNGVFYVLRFKPYVYFHWRWRILSVVWPFRMKNSLLSVRRLFNFPPEWDDRVQVSVRVQIWKKRRSDAIAVFHIKFISFISNIYNLPFLNTYN